MNWRNPDFIVIIPQYGVLIIEVILQLATQFARTAKDDDVSDSPAIVTVDPKLCQRRFHPPILLRLREDIDSLLARSAIRKDWDSPDVTLAEIEAIHERPV